MYLSGIIIKNDEKELWIECSETINSKIVKIYQDPNSLSESYKLGTYIIIKIYNNTLEKIFLPNNIF